MEISKDLLKEKIKVLMETGFFHIFGSTVINKILAFLCNIIVVRIISKEAFGVYTYANNILSFMLILSGLGAVSGVFQLCSENIGNLDKQNALYRYGGTYGLKFNVVLCVIVAGAALIITLPIHGANELLLLMCLNPIFVLIFQLQQIYLRSTLQNEKYAYVTMFNTAAILVFSVVGSLIYKEKGLIAGIYCAYILSIAVTYKRGKVPRLKKSKIEKEDQKAIVRISFVSMLNNGLSELLYLLDIFIIGLVMLDAEVVASYKIATIIPIALYFIPSSVFTYIYPYFAKNKNNGEWLRDNFKKTIKILAIGNLLITIVLLIFAKPIIVILFGKQYLDNIMCFRILSISYFFNGTFKGLAGNLLVAQRKLGFNLFTGIISAILDVIGNCILVPLLGANGAALTTLIIVIIISIISMMYYWNIINRIKSMEEKENAI